MILSFKTMGGCWPNMEYCNIALPCDDCGTCYVPVTIFKQTTNGRSQIDSTLILIVIGLPPAVRFFIDVVMLDLRGLTVTSPLCFCIKLTISFSWIPEPLPPVVFTMVAGCLPGVGCCTITTLPEIRDKTIIEECVTEYRQITMKFISLLTCS